MRMLLLATALAIVAASAAPQDNKNSIEGRVTRPGGSEGIPDVQITLQAQLLGLPTPAPTPAATIPAPQTSVLTDSGGHFSFKSLSPGRYQVHAQRDGYFGPPPTGIVNVEAPTTVTSTATVAAGQPTPDVTFVLLKGVAVSGRIRDPNGQPASGMQVSAYKLAYQNTWTALQSVNSKTTDDRGEYRLFWLPPGEYYFAVKSGRAGSAPNPRDAYATTFYPGSTNARTAQLIAVKEGVDMALGDMGILTEGTAKISGKVINSLPGPNDQPSMESIFYLLPTNSNVLTDTFFFQVYPNSATSRTGGQFELRGVMPGAYEVITNAPDSSGRLVWGRARVNVGSNDVEDVIINIQPNVDLKARVTLDGMPPPFTMAPPPTPRAVTVIDSDSGAPRTITLPAISSTPVPTPTIRLQLRYLETSNSPFASAANQNMTFDSSGVFDFPAVPEGRYTFQIMGLPPNAYISDVLAGGASVYDSGFDVNSQSGQIEVRVNSNGLKIQGTVRDEEQSPFASARIVLVPQQNRRQNTTLYKTAVSDAMGNFTFTGVAPGEYKLFAWEAVPNNAWMNAEFMVPYESRGQTVTASSAAASANVELKLVPK